jgi:hypothetical protein
MVLKVTGSAKHEELNIVDPKGILQVFPSISESGPGAAENDRIGFARLALKLRWISRSNR